MRYKRVSPFLRFPKRICYTNKISDILWNKQI